MGRRRRSPCASHSHPQLKRPVSREQVRQELERLHVQAGGKLPLQLDWTTALAKTHQRNHRRYAQVWSSSHPPRYELAPQTVYLPARHRLALLAHEVGHVLKPRGSEDDADRAAREVLGVKIGYDHRFPGKGLQVARNPPSFHFANWHLGGHGVQDDYVLYALKPGTSEPSRENLLGMITYSVIRVPWEEDDQVHISMIAVPEPLRRQGLGTALWRELERLWPGYSFPRGLATPEGAALRRSVGRNPPKHFAVRSPAQGLATIRHPAITKNWKRALKWRPRHRKAVLVPCAGTKPFPDAPSHRSGYLPALAGKDVDLWVVSEPLGIVPYAWSRDYPNAHYDFPPVHLRGAARAELVKRMAVWWTQVAPKYDTVFLALPGHHHRLIHEVLARVGQPRVRVVDAGHRACLDSGRCPPGHGRSTTHGYRKFLRQRVNPVRRNPDPRVRGLERRAHASDPEAQRRLQAELVRAQGLTPTTRQLEDPRTADRRRAIRDAVETSLHAQFDNWHDMDLQITEDMSDEEALAFAAQQLADVLGATIRAPGGTFEEFAGDYGYGFSLEELADWPNPPTLVEVAQVLESIMPQQRRWRLLAQVGDFYDEDNEVWEALEGELGIGRGYFTDTHLISPVMPNRRGRR